MTFLWIEPLLKATKFGGLDKLRKVTYADKEKDILEILQNCVRFLDCAFFFDNDFFSLSPYGYQIHSFSRHDRADCLPANMLAHDMELNEKSLRLLFTGIEFLLYKQVQLCLEDHPERYQVNSEDVSVRYSRLRNKGMLQELDDKTFSELLQTRNAFAHSFVDIRNIEYFRSKLWICFDSSAVERALSAQRARPIRRPTRLFKDDAIKVTNELVSEHQTVQMKQVDHRKLNMLLSDFVRRYGP
jgi:hypothetical protein